MSRWKMTRNIELKHVPDIARGASPENCFVSEAHAAGVHFAAARLRAIRRPPVGYSVGEPPTVARGPRALPQTLPSVRSHAVERLGRPTGRSRDAEPGIRDDRLERS